MRTKSCPYCDGAGTVNNEKDHGKELRELRLGSDLTLGALGKYLDVTASYVSDIERGRRRCPPALDARWRKVVAR